MTNFNKIPISQQSLKISDLDNILTEDMPGGNDLRTMQDKVMKILALALTEQKLPVVDCIKEHVDSGNPNIIDLHTFAVNLIENTFNMKSRMTRNMIQLLVNRYDDKVSEGFDYNIFVGDLEALEHVNSTQIRIFKT